MASNYRIVVIDPHAALEEDIGGFADANTISFRSHDDSTELFADGNTDIAASTELTLTLFKSLLGSAYSVQVERVLRYSFVALMTAQVMSLDNLVKFIQEAGFREKILAHVASYIPNNIVAYFEQDFSRVSSEYRSEVILPIVELIDEIQLQSGRVGTSSGSTSSLAHVIASKRLTIFSLNKVALGDKAIKTVSGLLIQQLFLLAQARQFNERIILIIDEVSIIQNPTLAQILAEARKYNLFVFLSQQYFGQIETSLQDAIFSNVTNYYVFKVSEHDARALEGNMTMELPKKMVMEATRIVTMEQDLRIPILTELDPRECVVRVSSGGKILPAFRGRTLDFQPTTLRKETGTLQTYTRQQLPHKFNEANTQETESPNIGNNKPQLMPIEPTNLMTVLSSQSSHRNTARRK